MTVTNNIHNMVVDIMTKTDDHPCGGVVGFSKASSWWPTTTTTCSSSNTALTTLEALSGNSSSSGSIIIDTTHEKGVTTSVIYACSPTSSSKQGTTRVPTFVSDRELLADRKGYLDHLRPKPLIISTMRVVVLQGSIILANFLTDQLEMESEREELVVQGKLTPKEADRENEEWERREWTIRWKTYPTKAIHGIIKFHAITILMRIYEHVASKFCDDVKLDRLTKDTFKSAIRKSDRMTGKDLKELGKDMFVTCLWANTISFLADYSVHQIILCYGYYVYYRQQRRSRRKKLSLNDDKDDGDDDTGKAGADTSETCTDEDKKKVSSKKKKEDDDTTNEAGMALSLALKSTKLVVSRSVGLVSASAGGALGTMVYPGWGTLFGTQIGDALVGAVLD